MLSLVIISYLHRKDKLFRSMVWWTGINFFTGVNQMTTIELINKYFSQTMAEALLSIGFNVLANAEEIRIRLNQPLFLRDNTSEKTSSPPYRPNEADISSTLERLCGHSFYAFADNIRAGFLTLPGGHRVGICGAVAVEDGRISAIKHVTGLNIRIAREVLGCADIAMPHLLDPGGNVRNTLIVSPPACGKTTLLRDIIRQISNSWANVALVDERGEVSGAHLGAAQMDLGSRTDVLAGAPKADGMMMVLRSMSPDVIAVDELGSVDDGLAVELCSTAGVAIICTVHGGSFDDLRLKAHLSKLLDAGIFQRYIFLSRHPAAGSISKILDSNQGGI